MAHARIYYITSASFADTTVDKTFLANEGDAAKRMAYWATKCTGSVGAGDLACDHPRSTGKAIAVSYTSVPSGCVNTAYTGTDMIATCTGTSPSRVCKPTASYKYSCRKNILFKQVYSEADCAAGKEDQKDDCEADPTKDAFCGFYKVNQVMGSPSKFWGHDCTAENFAKDLESPCLKYTGWSQSQTGLCMEEDPIGNGFDKTMRKVVMQGYSGTYSTTTNYLNSFCGGDATITNGNWKVSGTCDEVQYAAGFGTADVWNNVWYKETKLYTKTVVNTTIMAFSSGYFTDAECKTHTSQEFISNVDADASTGLLPAKYQFGFTMDLANPPALSDLKCHVIGGKDQRTFLDGYTSGHTTVSDASLAVPALAVLVPFVAAFL